jgi:hypothetical protein
MELMKIVGGLAVIGVLVFVIGMDREGGAETTAAVVAGPRDRSFSSGDSSARFVVPEPAATGDAAAD